ncbi:hypothetical protein EIK77_006329 [Talaromyces pinophilus]|nr:hypothetical protein EIK77_006329 [Talaromyces pinophilus]
MVESKRLQPRVKTTQGAELGSIVVKQNRDRDHGKSQKSQKTGCPWNAKGLVHLRSKEWEATTRRAPEEGIGSNGGIGEHQVDINDVVKSLHENNEDTSSNRDASKHLRYPADVLVGCPTKPEETNRQKSGAKEHGYKTLFGSNTSVPQLPCVSGLGQVDDVSASKHNSYQDTPERQGSHTGTLPATNFLEGVWVGFKKEVQDAVDQGKIDGDAE